MTVPVRPDFNLFTEVPEPPTGPVTDPRKFGGEAASTATRYAAWKATDEGWRVWRYIERTALDLAARGELRISTKFLCEEARRRLKVEINNNVTCLLSSDLVARHPHLLAVIERRRRRSNA